MKYKSFCLENSVPCPVSEMSSIQAAPKREEDLVMQLSHRLHPRSSVPSSGIWEWRAGTEYTFLLKDQPWCPGRGCGFPAFHPVCLPVPYCSVQESGIHLWHQHRRFGASRVPLCQGPPDPGSAASVLCPVLPRRSRNRTRQSLKLWPKGHLKLCPERSKELSQRSTPLLETEQ